MTTTPDITALRKAAEQAETDWKDANAAKELAVRNAKQTWALAAAAHSRYKRAEEKMERTQMRARAGIEAEHGSGAERDPLP